MVLAPQPYYQDPRHDISEMDEFWNGGPIGSHENGMAYGLGIYNCTGHGDIVMSTTWAWGSEFPGKIMNSCLEDKVGRRPPVRTAYARRSCHGSQFGYPSQKDKLKSLGAFGLLMSLSSRLAGC
jgi:hypothetical protein